MEVNIYTFRVLLLSNQHEEGPASEIQPAEPYQTRLAVQLRDESARLLRATEQGGWDWVAP